MASWKTPEDGRIKLLATHALLTVRRREARLFARGSYVPLDVAGSCAENVIAFARRFESAVAITVAGRFFTQVPARSGISSGGWAGTSVRLPAEWRVGPLRDAMTGASRRPNGETLDVANALGRMPFAVLTGEAQAG